MKAGGLADIGKLSVCLFEVPKEVGSLENGLFAGLTDIGTQVLACAGNNGSVRGKKDPGRTQHFYSLLDLRGIVSAAAHICVAFFFFWRII